MSGGLTIKRNNNPGAIRVSDWTRQQPGFQGENGGFAVFATPEDGVRAQETLLQTSGYRDLDVPGIIKRYAPSNENSSASQNNYAAYVMRQAGLKPGQPVPPEKVADVARAMREFETGETRSGGGSVNDFVADIEAGLRSPREVAPPNQAEVEFMANGPQMGDPAMRARAEEVSSSQDAATALLQGIIPQLQQNSRELVAEVEGVAETKRNLADKVTQTGNELLERMAPYQQKREELARRELELGEMNPIERGLKSLFDSDYDVRQVRGERERVENFIGVIQDNWQDNRTVMSAVAEAALLAGNASMDVIEAQTAMLLDDTRLAGQLTASLTAGLDAALLPYGTDIRVEQMNQAARGHYLNELTTEGIVDLANQAQAAPDGTITYRGTQFTQGQLTQAAQQRRQTDMSFRSMIYASEAQDEQLKDIAEQDLIDSFTPEQLEEVLKAGGVYKGQQLDYGKLNNRLAQQTQFREHQTRGGILEGAPGQVAQIFRQNADRFRLFSTRTNEMFGSGSPALSAAGKAIDRLQQQYLDGLEAAREGGYEDEYAAQWVPRLAEAGQSLDTAVSQAAKQWAGNKKELLPLATAYLSGQELNSADAVDGLITMARSGLPAGAKLSGPALVAYQAAQELVRNFDKPANQTPGTDIAAMLEAGGSKTERKAALHQAVADAVQSAFVDSVSNDVLQALPTIASQVPDPNDPKKAHPFSTIKKDVWESAIRHGDRVGLERAATAVGLNTQQIQAVLMGQNPELEAQVAESIGSMSQLQGFIFENQVQGMMEFLDSKYRINNTRPSLLLKDFLSQPASINAMTRVSQVHGGDGGFGSFIVASAAEGTFNDYWNQYAQALASSHDAYRGAAVEAQIQAQKKLFGPPDQQMGIVLAAMDMPEADRKVLMEAFRSQVEMTNVPEIGFGGSADPYIKQPQSWERLRSWIYTPQEDKAVERIRKRAVQKWDEHQATVERINLTVQE